MSSPSNTRRHARRTTLLVLSVLGLAAALGAQASPPQVGAGHYEGAGIVVTNFNIAGQQITVLDNGAVVCRDVDADGTPDHGKGGVCIPFADLQGDSVFVSDDDAGAAVAFQVCIDNNGDGICEPSTGISFGCPDTIVYSHESNSGAFHNPIKLPQTGFHPGCDSGQFPGIVVMICAGVHDNELGSNLHFHSVSEGQVWTGFGGTGYGDFCGAPGAVKAYTMAPPGF